MNKPSEMFDFLDKGAEFYNYYIDMDNQRIQQEINWLNDNYENIYALRAYFLRFANPRYFVGYMNYLNYLNSLADNDIQSAAENRVNALYAHMQCNVQNKIENKPLKIIAKELKDTISDRA